MKIFTRAIIGLALAFSASAAASSDITDKLRPHPTDRIEVHPLWECNLFGIGESIDAMQVGERVPKTMEIDPQYVLVLLSLYASTTEDGGSSYDVRRLPLLPDGGVGNKDFCGPMETQKMRVPEDGVRLGVVGMRLRPSLDLATAYPTFGPALADSGRMVRTKPKKFAAFRSFPDDEAILREALMDHPMVDSSRTMWTMPGLTLIPIKP